jgi:hypothetical protein
MYKPLAIPFFLMTLAEVYGMAVHQGLKRLAEAANTVEATQECWDRGRNGSAAGNAVAVHA